MAEAYSKKVITEKFGGQPKTFFQINFCIAVV
jgi:hypothetical protein